MRRVAGRSYEKSGMPGVPPGAHGVLGWLHEHRHRRGRRRHRARARAASTSPPRPRRPASPSSASTTGSSAASARTTAASRAKMMIRAAEPARRGAAGSAPWPAPPRSAPTGPRCTPGSATRPPTTGTTPVAVERLEQAGVTVRARARAAGRHRGSSRWAAPATSPSRGVVLNTGTSPAAPADRRAGRHAVLDQPRRARRPGPARRRWSSSAAARSAPSWRRRSHASASRVTLRRGGRPRILALEEPESSEAGRARDRRPTASRCSPARRSASVRARRRAVHRGAHRRRRHRARARRRPPARRGRAPPQPRRPRARHGRPRPERPGGRHRRPDAGRRPRLWAIGDITGKGAFTHMSMYQAGDRACATSSAHGRRARGRSTTRCRASPSPTPRSARSGLTEQQARDAGLDVAVGLDRRWPSSTRGWITAPAARASSSSSRTPTAGSSSARPSVGPSGGEVLSMLATAVHAAVPTATLRPMMYAYPTFHRAVETALADLRG